MCREGWKGARIIKRADYMVVMRSAFWTHGWWVCKRSSSLWVSKVRFRELFCYRRLFSSECHSRLWISLGSLLPSMHCVMTLPRSQDIIHVITGYKPVTYCLGYIYQPEIGWGLVPCSGTVQRIKRARLRNNCDLLFPLRNSYCLCLFMKDRFFPHEMLP